MSLATTQPLLDSKGRPVRIAPTPFAIGGEGSIHEVLGSPELVAKIYKAAPSKERAEKLAAMARLAADDLLKIAAWPTTTLHQASGAPVMGVLMPRIVGCKEIHHLYSVAQRKKDFPGADWRFLIHAARNCAIAFEKIHQRGHVVGDVNQKNVMVSDRAIVRLVDCDSFQVRAEDGRVFRCVVGVPEYTPPELQGMSFRSVDRRANHDLFGLAVLIFHLLMMGRHPFSGVYLDPGDMPLEKAIQGGRFAYARDAAARRMKPPPNTLPISFLDAPLIHLFERAFQPATKSGPPARPTAVEWQGALSGFLDGLGSCDIDPSHAYPKTAGQCPWCRLAGGGLVFFLPKLSALGAGILAFDLMVVWREIEAIAPPSAVVLPPRSTNTSIVGQPPPPGLPRPTPKPEPEPLPDEAVKVDPFLKLVAGLGIFVGFLLSNIAPPVGVVCVVGFAGWLVGLLITDGGRLRELRAAREEERNRIQSLNAELQRAWERENRPWVAEYRSRAERRKKLGDALSAREAELVESGKTAAQLFHGARRNLEAAKAAHQDARSAFDKAMSDLVNESARLQRDQYLDSFLIREAGLARISTVAVASLGSFGFETALDVKSIDQVKVPGIGPVLTQRLIAWREGLIRSFTPKPGVPDSDRAALEHRHFPVLRQHQAILAAGPKQLRAIVARHESSRAKLIPEIEILGSRLRQAEADLEVLNRQLTS